MLKSWPARVVPLLGAVFLFGLAAVHAVPAGAHGIGVWPVGGATAALVLAPRRWAPALAVVVGVLALLTFEIGGLPVGFSLAVAAGTALGVWAAWWLLVRGVEAGERPALETSGDLKQFFASAGVAAGVVAAATAVGAALSGRGAPGLTALTVGTAQVASQLTVLPFFLRLRPHASVAPPAERVMQWVLLATVTSIVFLPHDFPSLVFAILPLLAWGGLRANPWEALAQGFVVFAIAIQLTSLGLGPFADVARYGLPPDARPILLAVFGLDCAAVVVPMVQIVGEQLGLAREASAERDKVQNIVNGASGIAIVGTDAAGRITLFNPGAERLLGYGADDVLGRSTRIFHTDRAITEKAAELGVPDDFRAVASGIIALAGPTEMRFVRKDGVERTHSMTLDRVVDDRGVVTGYVSTSEDVTQRVEAHRAVVEALAAERTAAERLREVDRVKDSFVSGVSHELRTPITSITGYLEMLLDGSFGELAPAQADAVARVSSNSSRLLVLIDDLLTLSRLEDQDLELTDRALDLRALLRAGHDVVAPAWADRDLDVRLELPEEPVPFLGDRHMIERVVVNLLGNAVKFTPDGGSVVLRLTTSGDGALVVVSDTGIGIPADEQGRIFSRFFRSSTAQRRAIPGSGLGLSIARTVVDKHGGHIELMSEEGAGTSIAVWLPIVT